MSMMDEKDGPKTCTEALCMEINVTYSNKKLSKLLYAEAQMKRSLL